MYDILRGPSAHGGEKMEGLIYRVYNKDFLDFMAKYVRDDYQPGLYLPEISGCEKEVFNA
jgi:hypothetical protein